MSRPRAWLYPLLLAIIPVLHLAATNPGQWTFGDLSVVLAGILVACAALFAMVSVVARGRWDGRLPALIVLGVVLWFWGYPALADLAGGRSKLATHLWLMPACLVVMAGLGWWLLRRPSAMDRLGVFLTMAGGLVAVWSVVSIGWSELRMSRVLHHSELVRRLARPIEQRRGAARSPKRDIYLIVLDEYANAEITGARYGFDNHEFLDSLRQLGFVLPAVHSNYLHTVLSIPSLLNASQISEVSRDVTWKTVDPTVPNFLVENNRTVPFLKRQGYRFAFYPSLWWLATRHNRHADIEPDFGHSLDPVWMLSRSELRRGLRVTSVLDLLHRESTWHRADGEHMMRTFEAIARLPQVEGPVFAFAHVLSPHQPFTFDRDCRPFIYRPTHSRARGDAAYVQQIECLNRVVLRTVATILRNSDIPPVILLQGDHGSSTPAFDSSRTAEAIPWAAAYERLGAFGAYYLPDGGSKAVGDSVTVVNVLGDVLRYYLGADLPRESDAMYLSTYYAPYTFEHVDFSWLAGSGPAVARRVAPGAE